MAGCGLGALVFKENTMGMQILASTTNYIGMQTFAITSGTSNCSSGGIIKAQHEQAAFNLALDDVLDRYAGVTDSLDNRSHGGSYNSSRSDLASPISLLCSSAA